MKIEFVPIDYDYFDNDKKSYVKIIGRTNEGERVCVLEEYCANFWVILEENVKEKDKEELIQRIKEITVDKGKRKSKIIKVIEKKKMFLEKECSALNVFVENHKDLRDFAQAIGESQIIKARREHDIALITKYIMQGGLEPLSWYKIDAQEASKESFGQALEGIEVDKCLMIKEKRNMNKQGYTPRVLSVDIESEMGEVGKGKIFMIGLYSEGFKRVITYKQTGEDRDYILRADDEKDMIKKFIESVKEFSPDILTGYFSDGYDMPFLKERAKKYKLNLSLGADNSNIKISRGFIPPARINGVVHVDLYRFISSVFSQYLSSESLSLNDVAGELLGEGKEDFDFKRLKKMSEKDWGDFVSYNLRDVEITYKLFWKVWQDMEEFVKIVKEPLFEISRNTTATNVEKYILHNLERFNEIAQKKPGQDEIKERRKLGKFEGAFVYEPTPGLYENIAMFDFTSMYGSVIVSYNISTSTLVKKNKEPPHEFSKKKGFFAILLEEIIELRKKYKEEYTKDKDNMKKARSNAYKLLANSAYGYLGFFAARYYSREAASSTTLFAKENIHKVIGKIEKEGYGILYSDTDSIAFTRNNKSKKEVEGFLEKLNRQLPGIMRLELEGFFDRGLFVSKRTVKTGAKKKYALIEEDGNVKIRGFETIRRDWCRLSRELQSKVISSVLKTGSYEESCKIVKETIDSLKKKRVDKEDLIVRTQLRRPLNEYVANSPHIVAANKMKKRGVKISSGMPIEYYIGDVKGKNVGDRVFLPDEDEDYDVNYYLKNQILPALESIFDVFDVNIEEVIDNQKQTGIFDFGT